MAGKGPRRLSEIATIAARYQSFLTKKKGAKHPFRFEKAGKRPYPVKAHNAERSMIPWGYIEGLCRVHEIPESAFTE